MVSYDGNKSSKWSPKFFEKTPIAEPCKAKYGTAAILASEKAKFRGASTKMADKLKAESFLKSVESEFAGKGKKKKALGIKSSAADEVTGRKGIALEGRYEDDGLLGDIGGQGNVIVSTWMFYKINKKGNNTGPMREIVEVCSEHSVAC